MKTRAFTLAETLIVIGIIGVVAALTLPNLNHATGDKEKVTRVKKIYSALTEAIDRGQAIYGDFDTWFTDLASDAYAKRSERFAKRVTEFMKISKDCGLEGTGCFATGKLSYINQTGLDYSIDTDKDSYSVVTSDGMSLNFSFEDSNGAMVVFVDVDGPNKGKYQYGNDVFAFDIKSETNTLYPYLLYEYNMLSPSVKETVNICNSELLAPYWF